MPLPRESSPADEASPARSLEEAAARETRRRSGRAPVAEGSRKERDAAAEAMTSVRAFIHATAGTLRATEAPTFDLTVGKDFGVSIDDLKDTIDLNKRLRTQAVRTLRLTRQEAVEASAKENLLAYLGQEKSPAQLGVFLASVLGDAGLRNYIRGPVYGVLREDYTVEPVKGLGQWGVHETLVGSVHPDVDSSLGSLISGLLTNPPNTVFLRDQLDWSLRHPLVEPTAYVIGFAIADNLKPLAASALSAVAEHQLRDTGNITYIKDYAKEVLLETIQRHTRHPGPGMVDGMEPGSIDGGTDR